MKRSHISTALAVALGTLAIASGANAALDTAVTTAISGSQADMVEAGGLLVIAAATVMGLRWVKGMFF